MIFVRFGSQIVKLLSKTNKGEKLEYINNMSSQRSLLSLRLVLIICMIHAISSTIVRHISTSKNQNGLDTFRLSPNYRSKNHFILKKITNETPISNINVVNSSQNTKNLSNAKTNIISNNQVSEIDNGRYMVQLIEHKVEEDEEDVAEGSIIYSNDLVPVPPHNPTSPINNTLAHSSAPALVPTFFPTLMPTSFPTLTTTLTTTLANATNKHMPFSNSVKNNESITEHLRSYSVKQFSYPSHDPASKQVNVTNRPIVTSNVSSIKTLSSSSSGDFRKHSQFDLTSHTQNSTLEIFPSHAPSHAPFHTIPHMSSNMTFYSSSNVSFNEQSPIPNLSPSNKPSKISLNKPLNQPSNAPSHVPWSITNQTSLTQNPTVLYQNPTISPHPHGALDITSKPSELSILSLSPSLNHEQILSSTPSYVNPSLLSSKPLLASPTAHPSKIITVIQTSPFILQIFPIVDDIKGDFMNKTAAFLKGTYTRELEFWEVSDVKLFSVKETRRLTETNDKNPRKLNSKDIRLKASVIIYPNSTSFPNQSEIDNVLHTSFTGPNKENFLALLQSSTDDNIAQISDVQFIFVDAIPVIQEPEISNKNEKLPKNRIYLYTGIAFAVILVMVAFLSICHWSKKDNLGSQFENRDEESLENSKKFGYLEESKLKSYGSNNMFRNDFIPSKSRFENDDSDEQETKVSRRSQKGSCKIDPPSFKSHEKKWLDKDYTTIGSSVYVNGSMITPPTHNGTQASNSILTTSNGPPKRFPKSVLTQVESQSITKNDDVSNAREFQNDENHDSSQSYSRDIIKNMSTLESELLTEKYVSPIYHRHMSASESKSSRVYRNEDSKVQPYHSKGSKKIPIDSSLLSVDNQTNETSRNGYQDARKKNTKYDIAKKSKYRASKSCDPSGANSTIAMPKYSTKTQQETWNPQKVSKYENDLNSQPYNNSMPKCYEYTSTKNASIHKRAHKKREKNKTNPEFSSLSKYYRESDEIPSSMPQYRRRDHERCIPNGKNQSILNEEIYQSSHHNYLVDTRNVPSSNPRARSKHKQIRSYNR